MTELCATMHLGEYLPAFPHGIMFHHFYDEEHSPSGQGAICAEEFDEILNFVGINRILPPEEWVYKLTTCKLKRDDLCITFDDGLKCQYDICVPILEKYDLRCFWFVYSSVHQGEIDKFELYRCFRTRYFDNTDGFFRLFFDKFHNRCPELDKEPFEAYYNDKISLYPFYSRNDVLYRYIRDEILDNEDFEALMDELIKEKDLTAVALSKNLWLTDSHLTTLNAKGHYIGLHSYNHPTAISKMPYSEQLRQYERNYCHIKEVCGTEPISMAHPNNSYNNNTLDILGKLKIVCGFRSNMALPERGINNLSFLELPRMDHSRILTSFGKEE